MKALSIMLLVYSTVTVLTSAMILVAFNRSNNRKYDIKYWDCVFDQLWDFFIWFSIIYFIIISLTALNVI